MGAGQIEHEWIHPNPAYSEIRSRRILQTIEP
jgi:hypothetical protein